MARGSRIDTKTELKFRKKLLELGVVAKAAKAIGIPATTGHELAKRADKDAKFVEARAAMRARVVPEVEAKLLSLLDVIDRRIRAKDMSPDELADIAVKRKLKSFSYQNPKPQYFRGGVDLLKVLVSSRRDDQPGETSSGPAVVINLAGGAEVAVKPAG